MKFTPPVRACGFTLAETMLSAAITSTALVAVLSLLSSGIGSTMDSRFETSATILSRRLASEGAAQALAPGGGVAEKKILFDDTLRPMADSMTAQASLSGWYAHGAPQVGASFFATIEKIPPPAGSRDPARIIVTVEAPAAVPADKRRIYRYVTLSAQ